MVHGAQELSAQLQACALKPSAWALWQTRLVSELNQRAAMHSPGRRGMLLLSPGEAMFSKLGGEPLWRVLSPSTGELMIQFGLKAVIPGAAVVGGGLHERELWVGLLRRHASHPEIVVNSGRKISRGRQPAV